MARWRYEVMVGSIEGYVEADDEDSAMSAAVEDAYENAAEAIDLSTWVLWREEDE